MKKILGVVLVLVLIIVIGQGSEPSVCCEKTGAGAWCINANETNCNSNFKIASTSCESTSYCRAGTCYSSKSGFCMENTAKRVCDESNGTWDARLAEEIPQCQLGCCIIVDQAAFVPLVRCKRLASLFGVPIDYRQNINSELECIATANAQDVGACVFEHEFERNCLFTTRADCGAKQEVKVLGAEIGISSEKKFYENYLCSAEELNTICARQATKGCYSGKVYWFDSCGNRGNVYSSDEKKSWNNGRVLNPDEVCEPNEDGNANCGNCDYLLGTRCRKDRCERVECKDDEGNERKNGESWCVDAEGSGGGGEAVGSRYYKEACIDGVVRVEPCADFRNDICIEDKIKLQNGGEYNVAACRVNRWHDCNIVLNKKDCENTDKRDCLWKEAIAGMIESPNANENGVCVPNFAPGFDYWAENTEATEICGQRTLSCIITYEEGLIGGSDCIDNCECDEQSWLKKANSICTSMGDCGGYVNYLGKYTEDGFEWKKDGVDLGGIDEQGVKDIQMTGKVIGVDVVNNIR